MENFVRGKPMWGYISGVKEKSIDTKANDYATALEVWEVNNSKIITWVNNFVTHMIDAQLAKYDMQRRYVSHISIVYTI